LEFSNNIRKAQSQQYSSAEIYKQFNPKAIRL